MKYPPLRKNQAIISVNTPFGFKDYFLASVERNNGKYIVTHDDIDIDEWIDYIKTLKIDKSNNKMTAFCLKGHSLKELWDSIPENQKIKV